MTTRTRSRGKYLPGAVPYSEARFRTCSEQNWALGGYGKSLLVGEMQTMSDVVTPGFHKRKSIGEVFFNDMTSEKVKASITGGTWGWKKKSTAPLDCTNPAQRQEHRGITPPGFMAHWAATIPSGTSNELALRSVFSDGDIASMVTEATTRCLSLRGRSDQNLFESAAEITKTLQMLSNPVKSLHSLLTKAGAERTKLIGKLGRDYNPAALWLQYRYGILPIVRDIEGILRGMQENVGLKRQTTRAFVNDTRNETRQFISSISPLDATVLEQTEDTVLVRAMSLDEYVATVDSNIGFTTKGLLTTPWELIPYSFVIDWAFNIGDYLGAISPAPGYKQLGSCVVVKRTKKTTWNILSCSISVTWGEITESPSGFAFIQKETTTRRALGTPGLVTKTDFRLSNPVRQADAFSLLAQRMLSTFR